VGAELLTVNNIISALAWSCITRIRASRTGPSFSAESKLGFAVNGRKHLGKDFVGEYYLGNVNIFGHAVLKVSELEAASLYQYPNQGGSPYTADMDKLSRVISSIGSGISRISLAHIAEVIALVESSPNVGAIAPGWNAFIGPDLTITSWANLGVYECDFGGGLGSPDFVRVPYAEFDGLGIILPRCRQLPNERNKDQDGKPKDEMIEIVVFLQQVDMEMLERDAVWKSWTCDNMKS
jgi:hypothetical protein